MSIWESILDFVGEHASDIIPAVASTIGNQQSRSANDRAAEKQIQGAQEAADITTRGIDESLGIDLDTLEQLQQMLGDRFEPVMQLLAQAPAQYRDQILDAVTQAADITTGGVDRLAEDFQGIGGQYEGRMNDALAEAGDLLRSGSADFNSALEQVSQKYGIDMGKIAQAYSEGMGDVGQTYKADAERMARDVEGAYSRAGDQFKPLAEAGGEALGQLRQTAASDPGKLTSSQGRTLDKIRRSSINNLAAAGMRGAGRAGIAAVNEAEADYRASAEDQNRRRADAATSSLFSSGNAATGQIAGHITGGATAGAGYRDKGSSLVANLDAQTIAKLQAMGVDVTQLDANLAKMGADTNLATDRSIADLGYKTRGDTARTLGDLSRVVASSRQANTDKIGGNLLAAQSGAADRDYSTTRDMANETGNFYDRLMTLATGEGAARSGAVRGKAGVSAAAKQGASITDAQRTLANGQLTADTTGTLASIFSRPRSVAPAAASVA